MKCIILAAGYATRLYPLTLNKPKALLDINGKTVLERILNKVEKIKGIDDIYLITNDKFYKNFSDWASSISSNKKITVLNDYTTSNDTRLGAIGDMQYVIEKMNIDEEILVLASDNLFDMDLNDFVEFYKQKNADCITAHHLNDLSELQRSGVLSVDESQKVTEFEEKPQNPKSDLAVPPFYLYTKETVKDIKRYLDSGNNPDAPGHFVPWLITQKNVYAYIFEGLRHDIGTLDTYEMVQKLFKEREGN